MRRRSTGGKKRSRKLRKRIAKKRVKKTNAGRKARRIENARVAPGNAPGVEADHAVDRIHLGVVAEGGRAPDLDLGAIVEKEVVGIVGGDLGAGVDPHHPAAVENATTSISRKFQKKSVEDCSLYRFSEATRSGCGKKCCRSKSRRCR